MAHKRNHFPDHDQHDNGPQYEIDESPARVGVGFIHKCSLRITAQLLGRTLFLEKPP